MVCVAFVYKIEIWGLTVNEKKFSWSQCPLYNLANINVVEMKVSKTGRLFVIVNEETNVQEVRLKNLDEDDGKENNWYK